MWQRRLGVIFLFLGLSVDAADLHGYTEEFEPFNFTQDGQAVGLANEILNRVISRAKLDIERSSLPWLRAVQMNESENNSFLYSTVRTPDRELKYLWVGPFDQCEVWLIKLKKRQDIALKSFEDSKKYLVGGPRGSAGQAMMLGKGFPSERLDISLDEERNVRKLYAGRFDLSVGMLIPHHYSAKKIGLDEQQLAPAFLLEKGLGCYFAFNRGVDPILFQRFQAAYAELERSGEIKKIRERYLH